MRGKELALFLVLKLEYSNKGSIYKLKNIGDITPPCFTLLAIVKYLGFTLFQRAHDVCLV